ncbi:Xaa-Pro aminopeptidase [Salinisphaera dokdonensis CL-ES53]|uniref:Xaa-Pro aminopeptidase n=1 Tax=Salinisphaera dokdonensis CL-ES53 TaxID=1304272 RepID=A0ABV2B4J9_9GAMM
MDYGAYRDRLQERLASPELAFAESEYESRLAALRRAVDAQGYELLMLSDPSDLCYLTGYTTFEVSVQCVLLVSAQTTVLFVPAIEIGPAVYLSRVDTVIGYAWESPMSVARQLAGEIRKVAAGTAPRIGVSLWSGSLRPGLLTALQAALDGVRFDDIGALLDRIRLVKSAPELEYLKQSADITGAGLDAASTVIREGVVDHEIARAGANAMLGAGSEFMSMQPIVTTGFRSGIIHTNHAGHPVDRGDIVFTEFGAVRRRYTAPMMRTAVVGAPTDDMVRFHEIGLTVLQAVIDNARTGETFDRAARAGSDALKPIVDQAFFSGVYGYPVGIQFPPSWVAGATFIAEGSDALFETDMVFHLPICLRKPGEFGIGFSETIRVTPSGGERITRNDLRLHRYD